MGTRKGEEVISAEDARWKLAVCESCRARKMMPADSASCLPCERHRRGVVLSPEEVRRIVAYREPADIVRTAWLLGTPSTNAAVGLDMATGAVTAHRWPIGENLPVEETDDVIVLAVCPAHRRAGLPGLLAAGAEGSLSAEDADELACEAVVRSALGDEGRRFWEGVEAQFQQMPGLRERS